MEKVIDYIILTLVYLRIMSIERSYLWRQFFITYSIYVEIGLAYLKIVWLKLKKYIGTH